VELLIDLVKTLLNPKLKFNSGFSYFYCFYCAIALQKEAGFAGRVKNSRITVFVLS